jgi:hypothetical protein
LARRFYTLRELSRGTGKNADRRGTGESGVGTAKRLETASRKKVTMNTTKRFSIAFLFATAAFGVSAFALAEPSAKHQCDGKHDGQAKGAHFKKADKNNDGFLTKDEVGDQRWARIQVADANKDGKISQPEMQQAHKDGKLGHRDHKKA